MLFISDAISLNKNTVRASVHDMKKAAKSVNLVYTSDQDSGYKRVRKGKSFYYLNGNKKLNNTKELDRINKLVLPPAWENVWISKLSEGHLQATGYDVKQRKQYRYHSLWNVVRNHSKFFHLLDFGNKLPIIRKRIQHDLSLPGFPKEKVLAAAVSIMELANIRIGNAIYEKLYGSFGLTTLKDRHVKIDGTQVHFTFKGKKGVKRDVTFKSKKLARIIQGCKELPGKELFSYREADGKDCQIDSGMVNQYIKEISGGTFTAKDFRTWAGSVNALIALKSLGNFETISEMKQKIVSAVDIVAAQLGNTRAVCRKYYIHPVILELYENKKLLKLIDKIEATSKAKNGLMAEEMVLLRILKQY